MDKELEDLLKQLSEKIKDITKDKKLEIAYKALEKAKNDNDVLISVEKLKDGKAKAQIRGNNLSLLVTLIGLEKHILQTTNTSENEFNVLRKVIGVGVNE